MSRYVIEKCAQSSAAPDAVYRLLQDGSTWPEWGAVDSFELERKGDGEPEGVGAVRVFTNGRVRGRDEVTGLEQDRQLRYIHLGGLPVRGYRGTVDLVRADDGGTEITWHVTFDAKYPGTGWLLRRALGGFIQRSVDGLAKFAVSSD